jgi:hypothetical protein
MPTRCPAAHGQQGVEHADAGSQRRSNRHPVERRTHHSIQRQRNGYSSAAGGLALLALSIGLPSAFNTRPIKPGPPRSRDARPAPITGSPKRIPSVVSTGIDKHIRAAKADHLGQMRVAEPI